MAVCVQQLGDRAKRGLGYWKEDDRGWACCAQQAALASFPMPWGTKDGFCILPGGSYDGNFVLESSPQHCGEEG